MTFDILHCILGIVRSSMTNAFVQVLSRLLIVVICFNFEDADFNMGFQLATAAWVFTEVIRYSYYILRRSPPYGLLYARYSTFLVLYPVGVIGEVCVVLSVISHIDNRLTGTASGQQSAIVWLSMFLKFCLLVLYAPGLWFNYTYMLKQRKRVIGGNKVRSY